MNTSAIAAAFRQLALTIGTQAPITFSETTFVKQIAVSVTASGATPAVGTTLRIMFGSEALFQGAVNPLLGLASGNAGNVLYITFPGEGFPVGKGQDLSFLCAGEALTVTCFPCEQRGGD